MCGRYSLALRPAQVRAYFEGEGMHVDEAPEDEGDDTPRQSYNFAPGYHGLVYRADVPDWGAGPSTRDESEREGGVEKYGTVEEASSKETKYILQSMKWGLVPFWTKRNPDYTSMLKTINCRDDSLTENRGMWTTMKQRKRCIVIAQGFYEWLKKNGGKERIPHYIKRKDGKLMCMAGLWDCVQYEGPDEKIYSYTIITTSSSKQLFFLHDRMPVILENGSEDIRTWLNPKLHIWSNELQSLLIPYTGELEIYAVSKDVGKVGNDSPTFVVPISCSENKNNIANFFNSGGAKTKAEKAGSPKEKVLNEEEGKSTNTRTKHESGRDLKTIDSSTEKNTPLLVPEIEDEHLIKRKRTDEAIPDGPVKKVTKLRSSGKAPSASPVKQTKRTRSSTSTSTSPVKPSVKGKGSQKITSFFKKQVAGL